MVVMLVAIEVEAAAVALQEVVCLEASGLTAVSTGWVMQVAAGVAQMVAGSRSTSRQCTATRRYESSRCYTPQRSCA